MLVYSVAVFVVVAVVVVVVVVVVAVVVAAAAVVVVVAQKLMAFHSICTCSLGLQISLLVHLTLYRGHPVIPEEVSILS